jgi:hypothetical protein
MVDLLKLAVARALRGRTLMSWVHTSSHLGNILTFVSEDVHHDCVFRLTLGAPGPDDRFDPAF